MQTTVNNIPVIYRAEYRKVKRPAKAIKNGSTDYIRFAAKMMQQYVEAEAILIPIPSHTGKATYTKELCEAIQDIKPRWGIEVLDCLEGNARESFCEAKKAGRTMTEEDFGFRLKPDTTIPEGRPIYLVDNVVATGTTAAYAVKALAKPVTILTLAYDPTAAPLQKPTTVEDICRLVGCSLSEQDTAQHKIEMLLSYLSDNNIIEKYDEDRLDCLFSDNEKY